MMITAAWEGEPAFERRPICFAVEHTVDARRELRVERQHLPLLVYRMSCYRSTNECGEDDEAVW